MRRPEQLQTTLDLSALMLLCGCLPVHQPVVHSLTQSAACQNLHYFISSSSRFTVPLPLRLNPSKMFRISHFHRQDMKLIRLPASLHTPTRATWPASWISALAHQTDSQRYWTVVREGVSPNTPTAGFPKCKTSVAQSSVHHGNSKGVVATRQAAVEQSNSCSFGATSGNRSSQSANTHSTEKVSGERTRVANHKTRWRSPMWDDSASGPTRSDIYCTGRPMHPLHLLKYVSLFTGLPSQRSRWKV